MLNIFSIATSNAEVIESQFDAVLASLPDEASLIREFSAWVKAEGLISFNVDLLVVVELLNGNSYQNTYEWAQELSRLSGRGVEDILRERLGRFYKRRVTFDRFYEEGERFRYGALNAGGITKAILKPYCIVLSHDFLNSLQKVAYLPGDSLKICFRDDETLDSALIERTATPQEQRHLMVGKECAKQISQFGRTDWYKLLSHRDGYFEVIFIGEVTLNMLNCVRVIDTEYKRMWDMAFDNFGRKLKEGERALVHEFLQLRSAELDRHIRLEVTVED